MWTAGFPEPLTFSLRAARALRARRRDFDVVHDNQSLGYGLLAVRRSGLPVVATIHHPITVDRGHELAAATGWRRLSVRRWYGFHRMQRRVARRLDHVITVSESSARDIATDFGVDAGRMDVIPVGVDTELFRPSGVPRLPGRLVCTASADVPQKGLRTLLLALAQLRAHAGVHLVVLGRPRRGGLTERLVRELGLGDVVEFKSGLTDEQVASLFASAQVAVVPSLYEGFSLPAIEAMACGTALVATRAGAVPEVVGSAARLVEPGDVDGLAGEIEALLGDPVAREELGAAGRERVAKLYSWRSIAEATAEVYHRAVEGC